MYRNCCNHWYGNSKTIYQDSMTFNPKFEAVKGGKAKAKPAKWLRLCPKGCSKCYHTAGCTLSCWKKRGAVP